MQHDHQHSLNQATERVARALDRLEHSLQHVTVARDRDVHQDKQLTAFERENEELRQERENLNAAISQLKTQYTDLHQVASTIHTRLDDSIKRLSQIIEE
jgi:predicted RNase H-like nuclease (RuvC/YqgF family)